MKRFLPVVLPVLLIFIFGSVTATDTQTAGKCMTCHKEKTPGLYQQWYLSQHGMHKITCVECHGATKSDADAFLHEGAYIATLVTPKDCGRCHEREALEVQSSYHATAGEILESADAYMAHVAGGEPVAITGCESCHGGKVKIDPNSTNKLDRKSWPNSGIGRLNPDGSKGACNACHTRHSFSKAQARQPEACSKCHLGPDHPQKEVYEESKHGNAYYTHLDEMNVKSDRWVVGEDYFEAPTCATCHMSATAAMPVTHDVGQRISWTLRPPVSEHKDNWRVKRENMKKVCVACHGSTFVEGHYYQFDAVVELYNEKFAKPAGEIMKIVQDKKLMENPASFSNEIEWIYWEIWHHEGRRVRHGAAMMGPDYTWWHGAYDVAQHFYFKLIPEARKFQDPDVDAYIDKLLKDPMHAWLMTATGDLKEDIRSGDMQKIYEKLFEQK
ncbi:MAG: multiheme c-type cytochrome [Candidatus Zixiibacteriota bacterium]